MYNEAKQLFEDTFKSNYLTFIAKYSEQEKAAEFALKLAVYAIKSIYNINDQESIDDWSLEMYVKHGINIELEKPSIMRNDEPSSWFDKNELTSSFFWNRYKHYLLNIKSWPVESIQSIDDTTNEILKSLGDPKSLEPFDRRGLVLGYVQSGKTANFTGLINKAYDLGYKLIIVLSGMHNDLRSQTQIRLEEEVIGSVLDENGNPKGVAQIRQNDSGHIISTWTTQEKDISSNSVGKVTHINRPTLLVVKKNKTILETLREQLIYHQTLYDLDIPVLIVDDEADQASIDTSDPDKKEDPKTINKLIRQILELFERKAYVGYTATPFANLLINVEAETLEEGKDLYPKDFLVGLSKPKGYCGPEEFFNVFEDADYRRPSHIRFLHQDEIKMFDSIKKKTHGNKFEEVPDSMIKAILSFLITISVRNLRGQRNSHNSMLIHTTRFTDVQRTIKNEIEKQFDNIKNQILFNQDSKIVKSLKRLYENDFIKTTKEWSEEIEVFKWPNVYREVKKVIHDIQIMEINGKSEDTLSYYKYKREGLNVIAVGGDKLSRGLTLEGLSITYYYRNTLMYDTLMQMGRWFGYRKGYMDLCRIYTSSTIAEYFEHLAEAMVELRQEFDKLARLSVTPKQYAIKMLSHPKMSLTSPLKMKNAISTGFNYHGKLQQTRLFDIDKDFYINNMRATEKLINKIVHKVDLIGDAKTKYHMVKNVDVTLIIDYLREYRTSEKATSVISTQIIDYIQRANQHGELINWNVAIVDGDENQKNNMGVFPVVFGDVKINNAVIRGTDAFKKYGHRQIDKVDIGAIVAGKEEFIDLGIEDRKSIIDKNQLRMKRKKETGLLLVYPLHPKVEVFDRLGIEFSSNLVPIGIGISFSGDEENSTFNKREIRKKNKTVSEIILGGQS
ncbi:Z1 domain-containing protein [Bacillus cereus]|uniref:Z1 domain-containing protein n=1 Tax=Bacillus cereus TaxID=1396 RepID=UPI0024BC822E|nr:Z1 domain-containing protein [Bacillus cereus]WHT90734.1 Z1 domain-containing protein [Bacillus cereus]HDR4604107.1 Z1 domain-containing protein [Bacillus cereus]HDR4632557.1 Z1 domain-containing protein [Bacillus cereus]